MGQQCVMGQTVRRVTENVSFLQSWHCSMKPERLQWGSLRRPHRAVIGQQLSYTFPLCRHPNGRSRGLNGHSAARQPTAAMLKLSVARPKVYPTASSGNLSTAGIENRAPLQPTCIVN